MPEHRSIAKVLQRRMPEYRPVRALQSRDSTPALRSKVGIRAMRSMVDITAMRSMVD
jgi:hypothetical protein